METALIAAHVPPAEADALRRVACFEDRSVSQILRQLAKDYVADVVDRHDPQKEDQLTPAA